MTPNQMESEQCLKEMVRWTEDRNEPAPPKIKMMVAASMHSVYPSFYCVKMDRNQFVQGSVLMREVCRDLIASATLYEGYRKVKTLSSAILGCTLNSMASNDPEWSVVLAEIQGRASKRILEITRLYSVAAHHMRFVEESQFDFTYSTGVMVSPFVLGANIAVAISQLAQWETWDVEVYATKAMFPHQIYLIWPFLQLIRPGSLEQAARVWGGVDFPSAGTWIQQQPVNHAKWAYTSQNGETVRSKATQTSVSMVQALFASEIPHRVERIEAADWVPGADAPVLLDRKPHAVGFNYNLQGVISTVREHLGRQMQIL